MKRSPCSARSSLTTLSVVRVGLALGLALALVVGASTAGAEEDDALARYDGQWRRIAHEASDAARLDAIDTALGNLSWLVRKMATRILTRSTVPPGEMDFVWDGAALRQSVRGPNGAFERPVGIDLGPRTEQDPRGEETTIEWRRTTDGLEIHWVQSQAFGRNVYRLDPGDQTLQVEHRIQVTAIEGVDEIVYATRFGREALPPVSSSAAAQPVGGEPLELH